MVSVAGGCIRRLENAAHALVRSVAASVGMLAALQFCPAPAAGQNSDEPVKFFALRYTTSIDQLRQRFARESAATLQSPADYVMRKFQDHDIVLLGEAHGWAHNTDFLQVLLPRLHAAGIGFAFEPINARHQAELDRLVTASRFDEESANFLLLDTGFNYLGYREVLQAAWKLNRSLPPKAPRFRITALDESDMGTVRDWSQLRPGEKAGDPQVRARMIEALGPGDSRDQLWMQIIDREFIRKGVKAVVYAGANHTSTRFLIERGWDGAVGHHRTVGNMLFDYIGSRAFTILLHEGSRYRTQMVEDLLGDSRGRQFGIDLQAGLLGAVPSLMDGYLPMQKRGGPEGYTLSDVADGYIYLAPRRQWLVSPPIKGIYDGPRNLRMTLERKRLSAGDRNLNVTIEELEAADVRNARHYQYLTNGDW